MFVLKRDHKPEERVPIMGSQICRHPTDPTTFALTITQPPCARNG
jgi:hypothetical protein